MYPTIPVAVLLPCHWLDGYTPNTIPEPPVSRLPETSLHTSELQVSGVSIVASTYSVFAYPPARSESTLPIRCKDLPLPAPLAASDVRVPMNGQNSPEDDGQDSCQTKHVPAMLVRIDKSGPLTLLVVFFGDSHSAMQT